MTVDLVDKKSGEVLNEVQAIEKIAELKKQRQEISGEIKDLEIQILKSMDDLKATKRQFGAYTATVVESVKREFDEKIHQLVPIIGPDRFIDIVKIEPRWSKVKDLLKEGGAVREIIEGSLTEKKSQYLKIEGGK